MPDFVWHNRIRFLRLIKYCGLKAGVFVSVGKDIIHAEFIPAINGGVFGITK